MERLKKDLYSDESIPYLEENLLKYAEMASKIERVGFPIIQRDSKNWRLNDFVKKEYIEYFETLLDYFKKIVE